MSSPITIVRAATSDDADAAVLTLARAYDADPRLNWLIRSDSERRQAIRDYFRLAFDRLTLPHGCVEIADDLSGVALWTPPGRWKLGHLGELLLLPRLARVLGPGRLLAGIAATSALLRPHPREPHYFLLAMGVDPLRQRRGIGAALLRSRLDRCDAEGASAYLEATTDDNRRLYERWGFVARAPLRVAPDAPPLWPMWRAPRPPQQRVVRGMGGAPRGTTSPL